uniref:Orf virus homologue of retroviral pseudoprotease protein n=1 Tax=Orf virus TaxID=10258 RepID=Q85303_ORFV|nr:ORF6 [Orf virus]
MTVHPPKLCKTKLFGGRSAASLTLRKTFVNCRRSVTRSTVRENFSQAVSASLGLSANTFAEPRRVVDLSPNSCKTFSRNRWRPVLPPNSL